MSPLKVTIIQANLQWQDPAANLSYFSDKLDALDTHTDLVVLPEMFTTGFSMTPETSAEMHSGPGLQWMQQKAKEKNCVITGSIAVKDGEAYYNRLYWVKPDASYQFYNKRHLFRMGHEHEHYTAGDEKLIVELKGWKICPLVCYDLRFPVWSRNRPVESVSGEMAAEYDLLIYVANWPEVRAYPWKQLLIARAIENQCFVVGVNRTGTDGSGLVYSGDSAVVNPRGELLSSANAHRELCETYELDGEYLSDFRKTFPVMLDADGFEIS